MAAYKIDILAVTDAEARPYVGKAVVVGNDKVVFAATTCRVSNVSTRPDADEPGFFIDLDYYCRDRVIIPAFVVGKSSRRTLASLDAATYTLRRQREMRQPCTKTSIVADFARICSQ